MHVHPHAYTGKIKVENRHNPNTHTVDEGTIASKVQVLFVTENINTLFPFHSYIPWARCLGLEEVSFKKVFWCFLMSICSCFPVESKTRRESQTWAWEITWVNMLSFYFSCLTVLKQEDSSLPHSSLSHPISCEILRYKQLNDCYIMLHGSQVCELHQILSLAKSALSYLTSLCVGCGFQ